MDIKSEKRLSMFSKILFALYLTILVWVVIFKCNIAISLTGGYLYLKTITIQERFLLYIVPFQNGITKWYSDTILNVIVFIPMGLYISYFIKHKKFLMSLLFYFLSSLFLEVF